MDLSIDIASIIVLIGILIAAWYQRETVSQMKRQSDATVSTLTALNAQTGQMQEQTREMQEAMANESRPVLFATIANSAPPTLVIGNHGRNPAADLRIGLSLPLRDITGALIAGTEAYPSLPGWYRLVFELGVPDLEGIGNPGVTTQTDGDWDVPSDFLLELDLKYRDAISGADYSQQLKAEVTGTHGPVRLEYISE